MKFFPPLSIILLLAACNPATVDTTNYPAPDRAAYRLAGKSISHDTLFSYEDIIWGFTWLPDGSVIATEKSGKLLHIVNGKETEIEGAPAVYDNGQGGLLDVSLHPNYAENGWLYLVYSKPAETGQGGNTALARAQLQDDRLANFEVLYNGEPNTTKPYHFGSRIAWKDGKLYFGIGDRGERDVNPQDTSRDGGKIYRLNDDGSIPTDNPFVGVNGAKEAIYSYGHRNPQGLAYNSFTDEIWEHEHGPRGGDEVNVIEAGKNYGWPVITYGINYNGTQITQEQSRAGMEQPLHYWVPSIAPSGMAFVTGDKYPGWEGDLLVGSLKFLYLKHVMLEDGEVVGEEKLLPNIGRVRDVRVGPDGYIYASLEGTVIVRLLVK
ncbi:MAG: PQQ-dependent sugar dehydrogenase [Bacteroidota bacterium]